MLKFKNVCYNRFIKQQRGWKHEVYHQRKKYYREEAPEFLEGEGPKLLEVMLEHGTFAYPKTCLGEPIHNQQPYAPKEVYDRLMEL